MTHRLHTDLQGRLSDVLAADFLTPESRVELMAAVAIGTVLDDLIARCDQAWNETPVSQRKSDPSIASWLVFSNWLEQQKAEVIAS